MVRLVVRPIEHWTRRLAKTAQAIADRRHAVADLVAAGVVPEVAVRAVDELPRFKDMPGVTPRRQGGER